MAGVIVTGVATFARDDLRRLNDGDGDGAQSKVLIWREETMDLAHVIKTPSFPSNVRQPACLSPPSPAKLSNCQIALCALRIKL